MRLIFLFALLFFSAPLAALALPLNLAGITLGEQLEGYEQYYIPATAMGIREQQYLSEVSIDPQKFPGVRSGAISFGNCDDPGSIVQIKLKFDYSHGEEFYERLLKLYRQSYGSPDNWQGNVFRTIKAWEWVLEDGGQVVEIVLMYSEDLKMRPGVSIKFTLRSQLEKELACHQAKGFEEKIGTSPDPIPDLTVYLPK